VSALSPDSEETLRGQWWSAGNPDFVLSGTLTGTRSDRYTLKLDGALSPNPGGRLAAPRMTVCGTSNEGPMTLLECHMVKRQMRMSQNQPAWIEELQPIFVVKGADLGAGEPQFNRARVRLTNLEAWWAKRAIQVGPGADSFTYSAPDPDCVKLADGADLTIGAHGSTQFSVFDARMQQFTEVAVESPSLLPIRELSGRYIQPF
jgi:hypothetical protein